MKLASWHPLAERGAALSLDDYLEKKVREYGRGGAVTFIDEPDPETLFCPIMSVDDHALEPPDLFQGRMPARLADRAPTCRDQDDAPVVGY